MPDPEKPAEFIAAFDNACSLLRNQIKDVAARVLRMKLHPVVTETTRPNVDIGEMLANIMLAYRHLEDAGVRLGKAIQAYDGGKSVYDPLDKVRALASVVAANERELKVRSDAKD